MAVAGLKLESLILPRADGTNGARLDPPLALTVHYNGPAVIGAGNPALERLQLIADARYHIAKVWGYDEHDRPIHGKRIMYDYAVLSDGAILDLGNPRDLLFHCGNQLGNKRSRAVHVPVGGAQGVTDRQWDSVIRLYSALADQYHWLGRTALVGHCEWPRGTSAAPVVRNSGYTVQPGQSQCPGAHVMDRIISYRTGQAPPIRLLYHIRQGIDYANVRTAPDATSLIAVDGDHPARMKPGDALVADAIVSGASVLGEKRWLHRADGLGFVHWSLVV